MQCSLLCLIYLISKWAPSPACVSQHLEDNMLVTLLSFQFLQQLTMPVPHLLLEKLVVSDVNSHQTTIRFR